MKNEGHCSGSLNNLERHNRESYIQCCVFHRKPHSRWTACIYSQWIYISLVTLNKRHRIRALRHRIRAHHTNDFISTMKHTMLIVRENCLTEIYQLQLICSSWTATLGWMEAVHTLSLHTVSSVTYQYHFHLISIALFTKSSEISFWDSKESLPSSGGLRAAVQV